MHALMLRFVVHEGATSAVAGRPRDDEIVVWQNTGDDISVPFDTHKKNIVTMAATDGPNGLHTTIHHYHRLPLCLWDAAMCVGGGGINILLVISHVSSDHDRTFFFTILCWSNTFSSLISVHTESLDRSFATLEY